MLPGAEEVLALLEVRDQVRGGPWDLVVVDCAPTAETLRLLALPEAESYPDRMLPVERRVLRALSSGARRAGSAGPDGASRRRRRPPRDHVVDAVERLHAELAGVRRVVLTARDLRCGWSSPPSRSSSPGAGSLLTSLALYGYPVDGVVANRIVPGEGDDPWRRARARAQEPRLDEVGTRFRAVPVLTAGEAPAEPVGAGALADLGEELYGPPRAGALLAPPAPAARSRVERAKVPDGTGEEFTLVLPLPLATRGDVALARVGDDLALTVAGHRRVLALPSALRRCVVAGAGLDDGALRVRFRPDPALWPLP